MKQENTIYPKEDNELFSLAADVVNYTSCNLFLTGKAGTGKTTFLKFIKENSHKNSVVVAPTGVAAINAGGVTMHSFFQLPFLPYLPEQKYFSGNVNSVDRYSLIKGLRLGSRKIDLINELELLIIDEVSMLRVDLLDAVDEILRHFRQKRNLPFGGVQVLFIGDMYQLPPVVSDEEWIRMKNFYDSPFFFSAKVLEKHPPLFIELKKIYRQTEEKFINLLNSIRNNEMTEEDFKILHERHRLDAMDLFEESITLTTHNRTADLINQRELQKLNVPVHQFDGEITGNFSETALPTEMNLYLKEGAQIMFIKNDPEMEKRYFNGKLATVKKINEDEITVSLSGSGMELILEKEKWSNVQYRFNSETGKIEEEELGSYSQYPVRLAWAITIHKSQGLTFDRAVIDAGQSFAAGQVYVALSRCRTLEGLLLLSKILPQSVKSDERIVEYSQRKNEFEEIKNVLIDEKPRYASQILIKTFDWKKLVSLLEEFETITKTKKIPDKNLANNPAQLLHENAKAQMEISKRFITELENKFREKPIDQTWLNTKVTGAKKYFAVKIKEELIAPLNILQAYLQGKTKVRKYAQLVNELENILWKRINDIQRVTFGDLSFDVELIERNSKPAETKRSKKTKQEKGSSKLESLNYYKQGMKIEEIAKQRGMANSTIEGHLAEFVSSGELNVFDFVSEEQLDKIKTVTGNLGYNLLGSIKNEVGDSISYGQIRMAVNYLKNKENISMN
ncbi:MAG: helix-turn-helix domain-containing protein [Bacteroidia bacterium]